ncbi:S-layer homology domain-containing protein [Pseudoflavonifractor phocaeensis]|uniref:S-layer homology domain-containing protein n=1 Tax=Pseudoflavonifractor phocaeensis TaxID=1870988 RepID=UPI001957376D|nr:S-layer homology domain-containing protein [Pseudoflavonifractor phocaeensis]
MKRIAAYLLSLSVIAGCCTAQALAAEPNAGEAPEVEIEGCVLPLAEAPSDWAAEEVDRALELGLVPDELRYGWQQPITRAEFACLALRYLTVQYGFETEEDFVNLYGNAVSDGDGRGVYGDMENRWGVLGDNWRFTDVTNGDLRPYINAANYFGVVNGTGDGSTYEPDRTITRQEAACMLLRSYRVVDDEAQATGSAAHFADSGQIADWASADVAAAESLGIMQGTDTGAFDPLGTYTREQAVLTFVRLYESVPEEAVASMEEIQAQAYEKCLSWALSLGDTGSTVDFRADTDETTILAVQYHNMMSFGAKIVAVDRTGAVRTLWGGTSSDWVLSEDEATLTFTADGTVHTVEL